MFFYSDNEVDDLQMKELQDQLEAEQYFSVSWVILIFIWQVQWYVGPGLAIVEVSASH